MKKILTKLLAVMLVCLFAISGFNFSVIADNSADHGEKLAAMNVEVSGKISLMFYFTDMNDVSYFKVTVPNKDGSSTTTTVDKSDLKIDSKGRYLLKVPVAAAQQTDKVTVTSYNSANVAGTTRSYAVKDYADLLFTAASSNSSLQPAAKAVEAMLNYGAMAQAYFEYNTENPANADLYYRGTNPVNGMDYEDLYGITASEESGAQGDGQIAFTAVNAYLEDTVSLRFYFEYSGTTAPENLTVQINETQYPNQVLKNEQGKYYILINNIPATLFNETYQVLVSDGPSYAVVKYSVLNYLQDRLAKTAEQAFMDVAYSMFQFYGWTNEYKGNSVISGSTQAAACEHARTHILTSTKEFICSDCGHQTGNFANSFALDDSGTVTSGDFSYSVSGGDFEATADNGLHMEYGEVMTISGTNIKSTADNNYFTIDYYATAPVKVTMNYSMSGKKTAAATSQFTNTAVAEEYYLEAGENLFSAFEYGSLDSRKTYYGVNSVTAFTLTSIQVTPLAETGADFVMFEYTAGNKSVSFDTSTHGGAETITEKMIYVKNSRYKLGVSITYGGAISELYDLSADDGTISGSTNLVNRYDTGRLIQQSYYGTLGENDDYEPRYYSPDGPCKWHYNPVQGGDEYQNRARLIDYETGTDANGNTYVYIKTQPRDWAGEIPSATDSNGNVTATTAASDGRFTFCYMENRYTLTDTYVQVDNRMVDYSDYEHPFTGQELPAFYTLSYFNDYYWYKGATPWADLTDTNQLTLEHNLPFWGYQANVAATTFNYQASNTETWAAFVNESTGYGIGMYVPNTDVFKGGITTANNTGEGDSGWLETSAEGLGSSYFTPQKIMKIVPFEAVEYSYLIAAGTVNTIRETFRTNKDFTTNYSLNKNTISQKIPNEPETMEYIDFSVEDNLLFLQSVQNAIPSYDTDQQAAKIEVDGDDSYFHIPYNLYDTVYTADNYTCIEIKYMIPADSTLYPYGVAGGQELYYQLGTNTLPSLDGYQGNPVTFIADGQYHVAKIYTGSLNNWTGTMNSLRLDFLNDGITSGQVIYIKYISLTDEVETNANQTYVDALNVGVCGSSLASMFTDGQVDFNYLSLAPAVCNDDYVKVINSDTTGDVGFGFTLGGGSAYGQYLVIKYRTNTPARSPFFSIFATSGSTTHSGNSHFTTYGVVGDGRWHTLVVDLSASADVTPNSLNSKYYTNEVRIDLFDAFPAGTAIDFAYIGVCDDVSMIALGDNEYIEYGTPVWQTYLESVTIDGVSASKTATNNTTGVAQPSTLEGCVWDFSGWVAIDGQTLTDVSVCVADEAGNENWTTLTKDGSASNRWLEDSGVTSYVTSTNVGYGSATKGYRIYSSLDLSEYAGKTVMVSIRAVTGDGYAVTIYAVKVKVALPLWSELNYALAGDALYSDMFGGRWDAGIPESSVTKNTDGTISVEGTGTEYIGITITDGSVTGQYMVIKYRTSAIPTTGVFLPYASATSEYVNSDADKMTAYGLVGDGRWHTLVIDLTKSSTVTPNGDGKYCVTEVRLDWLTKLPSGSTIDFAYIGFCDELTDVKVKDGEYVEYGWEIWKTIIDSVTAGGTDYTDSKSNCNYSDGATQQTVLNGDSWTLYGWFGISGQDVTDVSVCITEENGAEHWSAATKTDSDSGSHIWWKGEDDIQTALQSSYASGTIGYRIRLSADLANYAGQTVTVSVRAVTADGRSVTVYAARVTVEGEFNPKWHLNIDSFYYCQNANFSDLATFTGSVIFNGTDTTTSLSVSSITANYIAFASAWVSVDGVDLSGMTYTVYDANNNVLATGTQPLTATPDEQTAIAGATGHTGAVAYRVNYATDGSNIVTLAGNTGTVRVVYTVTVDNAKASTIDVLEITVTVP